MNYEEIIERLLQKKHINFKEALYLNDLCSDKSNPCRACLHLQEEYEGESPCDSCTARGRNLYEALVND